MEEQQDEDDSEEIPPKEWKELIKDRWGAKLKKIDIETFQKQFMEHPKKDAFINWKDDNIQNQNQDSITSGGMTMVYCAIFYERFDIAKLLLDHGADYNIPDKDGDTAVEYASYRGYNEIVKLLSEKGVDMTVTGKDGMTALMSASSKGNKETVKLLLEMGADVTAVDKDGENALSMASRNGHNEIVKLFMENGETEEMPPKDWKELINVNDNETLKNVDTETFQKQFMEHPKKVQFIDWQNDGIAAGNTILLSAIECKRWDIVKLLLDHGADVNIAEKGGWTALMWASSQGHNETVKRLLEMGADVTHASKRGTTALNWAYRKGHNEIVKLLLQQPQQQQQRQDEEIPPKDWKWLIENSHKEMKNVDTESFQKQFMEHPKKDAFINWRDDNVQNGNTMLSLAIYFERFDIAKLLVEHGADATIADNDGDTALTYASRRGHKESVELLFEKGADVTAANKKGKTALMEAAENGHNETVKRLVEMRADVTAANEDEWTALNFAYRNGQNEIVKFLLQQPQQQQQREDEEIPSEDWKWLIENSEKEMENVDIETFQKQWMEHPKKEDFINWKDDSIHEGRTMCYCAIKYERYDIAKLLLAHGADITITNKHGVTALMAASLNGHNETVKQLLEKGADVKVASNYGWTALMYASQNGHTEILKLLIEMGADVTATNKKGETALNWAYRYGHNETVKLLLLQPQQQQQREDEETPPKDWKWLMENGEREMKKVDIETFQKQFMEHPKKEHFINWRKDAIENGDTMLSCAIYYDRFDIAKLLVEYGADVKIANRQGTTPLMWASWKGHKETVKLLLEKGAEITTANDYAETALTWASQHGHHETVEFLLEMGADATTANLDGETALMGAAENGHNETVKLLLEKGVDVTVANNDGNTALSSASKRGHNESVKLLLAKGADCKITNKNGRTVFAEAYHAGQTNVVNLLLAKAPPKDIIHEVVRLLFDENSIKNVETTTIIQWIERPEKENFINWTDDSIEEGRTMLLCAIRYRRWDIGRLLMEGGADVNIASTKGETALMYASNRRHGDTVNLLLDKGADRNAVTMGSELTALMLASRAGYTEIVDLLLDGKDGNLNIADKDGNTALGLAVANGHTKVVELLLAKGADCKITNKNGRAVFSTAYYDRRTNMVNLLLEKAPLKDIIHEVVNYADFGDKFFQLYQENREIVNWLDDDGRTVRSMACKECREAILFMGQYDMDDQPMYESPTCKIYNALDYGGRDKGRDEQLKQPRSVAMKFMEQEQHFLNEIRARQKEDGSARFASEFVTPYFAAYRADEHRDKNEEYARACNTWKTKGGETERLPDFCIPMPRGGRSLMESMNAENLSAKHKDLERRDILQKLCKIFVYLHGTGYIHGDVKPHNVVRHMGESVTWKAIDFDACTKIGDVVGLKLTTGSAPPEMLKMGESTVILRKPGVGLEELDLVKADASFDVWSFGILMYQLVTGRSFFHCDLQGNVDNNGLKELANLTEGVIHEKLDAVEDAIAQTLLKKILRLDPQERPTMSEIEGDKYLNPFAVDSPTSRISSVEYTSSDQEIPKNVTKLVVGSGLDEIAKGVCSSNGQLEEVDTREANSLVVVGEKAFEGCSALEEFQCPPSVKEIGLDSFHECVKLRNFTFSEALVLSSIGDRAFYGCRALTTFKCPPSVKTIGKYSFHGCQTLKDVDLSEAHALESIEGKAFSSCGAVQKVAIPENVTVVGEGFLDECDALESLVIAGDNPILHINVLLKLPETKRNLISMDSIVEMYSNNPVKKSELSGESSEVDFLLRKVKDGYIDSIRGSDDPIRKIAKRDGWVQFLSAHANDSKEDCMQTLISFLLDSEAKIDVVRMLADATDRLGRVAKMIAPEHIRKVFEKRLFFLGRYDIAKGPPIHKSATCIVMKATDAQMPGYYKARFEECAKGMETVDKEKFTEILHKMKLISYDEKNIKELFHKVDVDNSGTVSKDEFVDFCMVEIGRDVVLKFMRNKDQYRRERNGRKGLDARFVVGCIHNHDTITNPDLIQSLEDTMQPEEDTGGILQNNDDVSMKAYCYVLVMPFGDRNLAAISQSERPGSLAVRKMMQEVGEALCHLHEKGIVHGDLKMLNVVRSNGRLSLIDLDASGRIGKDFMGSKFSSGVVPPEMLYKLKKMEELSAYKNYVAKGGSKGEIEKRNPNVVDHQCFVVRSFWGKEVLEETNYELTGKTLTTLKSIPMLDGLPYSEVRYHPSFHGRDRDKEGSSVPVLVEADPSFDVWSFGVLLYRLLTKEPLFHVNDEEDITKGEEMKKLYEWSDNDLNSTIESDVFDPYAKRLLKKILRSDPRERPTMAQVLNDDYFTVELVKNMSDVHEKLSTIEKISLDNRQLMKREFARVHSLLQQIQRFQVEANKLLHKVLDGQKVPRYFVILPKPDITGSSNKMTCKWFLDKVKGVTNPDTYINQPARLCFICPLSLQPVVDASGQAVGFDIEVPQDWVKDYGPALLIGMKVAQVAMSVGRCFGLPLPSLSGAEEALAERSEVLSKLQEMVVSGLGGEDEEEEGGTIADALVSTLTDKLEESASIDLKTSKKIRDRLQESYSGIEKLIGAKDDIHKCGLIQASYVNPEAPKEIASEYVHPEWEEVFVTLGRKCFDMSMEELEMEKAKLDSSSTTSLESKLLSSDDVPATGMEIGGEIRRSGKAVLGETAQQNQGSTSTVYAADEVSEEISMFDLNIPELPDRGKDNKLYGKLERKLSEMDIEMERKVERKLSEMDFKMDFKLERKIEELALQSNPRFSKDGK